MGPVPNPRIRSLSNSCAQMGTPTKPSVLGSLNAHAVAGYGTFKFRNTCGRETVPPLLHLRHAGGAQYALGVGACSGLEPHLAQSRWDAVYLPSCVCISLRRSFRCTKQFCFTDFASLKKRSRAATYNRLPALPPLPPPPARTPWLPSAGGKRLCPAGSARVQTHRPAWRASAWPAWPATSVGGRYARCALLG